MPDVKRMSESPSLIFATLWICNKPYSLYSHTTTKTKSGIQIIPSVFLTKECRYLRVGQFPTCQQSQYAQCPLNLARWLCMCSTVHSSLQNEEYRCQCGNCLHHEIQTHTETNIPGESIREGVQSLTGMWHQEVHATGRRRDMPVSRQSAALTVDSQLHEVMQKL